MLLPPEKLAAHWADRPGTPAKVRRLIAYLKDTLKIVGEAKVVDGRGTPLILFPWAEIDDCLPAPGTRLSLTAEVFGAQCDQFAEQIRASYEFAVNEKAVDNGKKRRATRA